jgi:hypothetical protein
MAVIMKISIFWKNVSYVLEEPSVSIFREQEPWSW